MVVDCLLFFTEFAGLPIGQKRTLSFRSEFEVSGLVGRPYAERFRDVVTEQVAAILETFYRREFPDREFTHWGDKLPSTRAAAAVQRLFPATRFVLMVRDPRDALASYRRYAARPEIAAQSPELADMDTRSFATTWRNQALSCIEHLSPLHVLRYEDWIEDERGMLEGVLEFLGLGMTKAVERELEDEALLEHHGTSASASASIGRWRNELEEQEVATISDAAADAMERFEYATS